MYFVQRTKNAILFVFIAGLISFTTTVLAQDVDRIVHGPSDKLIHFGVVVKNSSYTIYRSSALGKHGLKHLSKMLDEQDLPFPKTIIYMNYEGYAFPFYFAIKEYKASLSGAYGEFDFFHPFGALRTYVDGEDPYHPTDDIDTTLNLGPIGQRYFSLQDVGISGGTDAVIDILKLVLDPERQPVLFHCFGGLHRTGMIAMLVRFVQGGFWVDGPKTSTKGMQLNPAEYEYAKFNPILFRKKNIQFVEKFSHDPRFLDLQDQYQAALADDENVYFGKASDSETEENAIFIPQVEFPGEAE